MLSKLCSHRRHGYASKHSSCWTSSGRNSLTAIASATPCIVGVTSHKWAIPCSLMWNDASMCSKARKAARAASSAPATTSSVGTYNFNSAWAASVHPRTANITWRSIADLQAPGSRSSSSRPGQSPAGSVCRKSRGYTFSKAFRRFCCQAVFK